jgi:surface antigen
MKRLFVSAAILLATIAASASASAMSCVAYVKSVATLDISGNAWAWWDGAEKTYDRDHDPRLGAIMVFSRTRQMPLGHVALVAAVNGPREILIDQANWHRGRVEHGTIVRDLSENNDWSRVSVQWQGQVFGFPTPVNGFIYPPVSAEAKFFQPAPARAHLMLAAAHPQHRHDTLERAALLERQMMRRGQIQLAAYHRPTAPHHAVAQHRVLTKAKATAKH